MASSFGGVGIYPISVIVQPNPANLTLGLYNLTENVMFGILQSWEVLPPSADRCVLAVRCTRIDLTGNSSQVNSILEGLHVQGSGEFGLRLYNGIELISDKVVSLIQGTSENVQDGGETLIIVLSVVIALLSCTTLVCSCIFISYCKRIIKVRSIKSFFKVNPNL